MVKIKMIVTGWQIVIRVAGWSLKPATRIPPQPNHTETPNTHRTKNTTNVVIQQNSRKLLMMDILMSETCWAHKKWNKIAIDINLVFYSSTTTMMYGPINIRLTCIGWQLILPTDIGLCNTYMVGPPLEICLCEKLFIPQIKKKFKQQFCQNRSQKDNTLHTVHTTHCTPFTQHITYCSHKIYNFCTQLL